MKMTSALVAAAFVAGSVSAAFAGGPVIVPTEKEPAPPPAVAPVSSFGPGATALAVIGGVAVIAAVAASNDSSSTTHTP